MKQVDFESNQITGNILRTALPMLAAQLFQLLYNIVDRIFIARIPGAGTAALGGVGICFPIVTMISAFTNLYGSGGMP
ncbi:MAG: MATE family efflux transporter, partial [Oscillospiraceae bacterium]|nr:MATE family efflux transporter [Oscillospiraceae bacterium]